MPFPSTFSIVAYDPGDNAWGVAVASKFLAVGSVVPWAQADAGAIATQSYANTRYGPQGLKMMAEGVTAQNTLEALISTDPNPELRQVGAVDAKGGSATYTGKSCYDWAGGVTGDGYAVQGNILAGEQVIMAMAEAFEHQSASLMWRLYNALSAGDRAGGDRRGKQSAAIYIVKPEGGYGGYNDRWVDYRVDDHPEPVKHLGSLLELHELYFGESPAEDMIHLVGNPLKQLQKIMSELGHYPGDAHGDYDAETQKALETFIGNENFEERTDIQKGYIDRPVYEYLIHRFGDG